MSAPDPAREPQRLSTLYPWLLIAVAFIVLGLSQGSTGAMGVFLPHMAQELGWTRTTISAAVALFPLVYGLVQPAAGWLQQRLSPLLMLAMGSGTIGSALLLIRYTTQPWHLLAAYSLLAGVGTSGASLLVASALVNRSFTTRRGLALGLAASGLSAGRLLLIPASGWFIVWLGWRPAWSVLGLLVLAGTALTVLVYLLRPRRAGAGSAAGRTAMVGERLSWWRDTSFWRLAGSFAICGFSVNLFALHLPGFALERNLPATTAALALGVAGGLSAAGTILAGWLSDFLPQRYLLSLVYLLRSAGLAGVALARDPAWFVAMALVAGTTLLVPGNLTVSLAGNAYGHARGPMIYGFTFIGHQVAGGIATLLGGLSFDLTGTYAWGFWLCALLLLVGSTVIFGFAERRPVPAGGTR